MVRIVNGEVVIDDPRKGPSTHTTPLLAANTSSPLLTPSSSAAMPPLALGHSSHTLASSSSSGLTPAAHSLGPSRHATPLRGSTPRDSVHSTPMGISPLGSPKHSSSLHATSPPPPPLQLSAQYTNPYLSHTTFGAHPITSGHNFNPHEPQVHPAHAALAQAAAYYPYLQGFLGPGFILGSATNTIATQTDLDATQQEQNQEVINQHQPYEHAVSSSLPILPVYPPSHHHHHSHSSSSMTPTSTGSSSAPSPLLTSTSSRRRSKPHIQFIPPTHTVTSGGVVVPVLPLAQAAMMPHVQPQASLTHSQQHQSPLPSQQLTTSARVSHAFNLFGLPPIFIYEIRIPPHVYLLTGLILYAIGPPALIPLVVLFFFWRWHLQRQAALTAHLQHPAIGSQTSVGGIGGTGGAHPTKSITTPTSMMRTLAPHPSGVPKPHAPSPLISRKHPNIHSLYDSQ